MSATDLNTSSQILNTSIITCLIFPSKPHQCDIIVETRRVTAAFSLVGCLIMIFVIWLFKKYLIFAQRLILYLTIAALMECIAFLMGGVNDDGPLCNFQGWWLTCFHWCVLLWVGCVTFNLYMNVIKQKITERYEWVYHIVGWVIPFVISCIPFIGDHYGPAGAWCWIVDDQAWRFGIWYIPLFIGMLLLLTTYIYIIYSLKKKASTWEGTYNPDIERNQRLLKEDIKPLKFYPCVYLIVTFFPLINRIQNAISPNNHIFWLVLLASISAPLIGALNAIVYGMDIETLKKLTPRQIMIAFMGHFAPKTTVQEYRQGEDTEVGPSSELNPN